MSYLISMMMGRALSPRGRSSLVWILPIVAKPRFPLGTFPFSPWCSSMGQMVLEQVRPALSLPQSSPADPILAYQDGVLAFPITIPPTL